MASRTLVMAGVLMALLPSTSASQTTSIAPRPEVRSWDFWIGDWALTGTSRDSPTGPEYPIEWRAQGRWILEGAAVEFTTTWLGLGPPSHWVEILSWDPAARMHTFTGFSSDGAVWSGTSNIGDTGFVEDFVVTKPDGKTRSCHNEWTFGVNRMTVSGKSVCKDDGDQFVNFEVQGSKAGTPEVDMGLFSAPIDPDGVQDEEEPLLPA